MTRAMKSNEESGKENKMSGSLSKLGRVSSVMSKSNRISLADALPPHALEILK